MKATKWKSFGLVFLILTSLLPTSTNAASLSHDRLADAIYWAEGGPKSSHPYGLIHYQGKSKVQYRAICLRHIADYEAKWNGKGEFLPYLASYWAPTNKVSKAHAKINSNWLKNVRWYMAHPKPVP